MGFGLAELRLLQSIRQLNSSFEIRHVVVGRRQARRYANLTRGRWAPSLAARVPRVVAKGADLVHLTALDLRASPSSPFILTIQDLAPLRFDDEGSLPDWAPELADSAARVLVPSSFTAREVEVLFGISRERIVRIPLAPGYEISARSRRLTAAELDELGLARSFVLRLGGYTRRKNFPLLLKAWPAIRRRTGAQLVLAGPPHAARDEALAEALALDGVRVLDYVPSALVPHLVRSASVMVSTSIYEGFGLPPLEAMGAGTPVVAVKAEAVMEVCGEAAMLVGDDSAELAEAVIRVLMDGRLRSELSAAGVRRASGFSWRITANRVLEVYESLLD